MARGRSRRGRGGRLDPLPQFVETQAESPGNPADSVGPGQRGDLLPHLRRQARATGLGFAPTSQLAAQDVQIGKGRELPYFLGFFAGMTLLPAMEMFQEDIAIQFNLACYECVLGNISQGKLHLLHALNLAHFQECSDDWKKRVLENEDLKPRWGLWNEDAI